MKPVNQNQHKIPQVYLKTFGYVNQNEQWMVSVIKRGENFTRQKSIGSFASATNIFDIESDDPRIPRMFEHLNGDLETEYNNIVTELEDDGRLSNKSESYLIMLVANLIVRSDYWREVISGLLETDAKENFLQIILGHHCKDEEEFGRIRELEFFIVLAELPSAESINRVLIYFIDHLLLRLEHYEITFIQSQEDKPWFTSTNPVVVHNRTAPHEILTKESELYFPLTPDFLVYMHYKGSDDQTNVLRSYASNTVTLASDDQNAELQHFILDNDVEYVVFAGESHFRREDL